MSRVTDKCTAAMDTRETNWPIFSTLPDLECIAIMVHVQFYTLQDIITRFTLWQELATGMFYFFTARIRRMGEGNSSSLSVHTWGVGTAARCRRGGGGYSGQVQTKGYPSQVQMGGGGTLARSRWGYPSQGCLLRSHRRTFLLPKSYGLFTCSSTCPSPLRVYECVSNVIRMDLTAEHHLDNVKATSTLTVSRIKCTSHVKHGVHNWHQKLMGRDFAGFAGDLTRKQSNVGRLLSDFGGIGFIPKDFISQCQLRNWHFDHECSLRSSYCAPKL